jgi:hypothetical protein
MAEWLNDRMSEPLPDCAATLARIMTDRAQRVAFAKGQFRTGGWHIPTRIAVLDGYLLRDSNEAGGDISLRWETLAQVLISIGLTTWRDGRWGNSMKTYQRWTLYVL